MHNRVLINQILYVVPRTKAKYSRVEDALVFERTRFSAFLLGYRRYTQIPEILSLTN